MKFAISTVVFRDLESFVFANNLNWILKNTKAQIEIWAPHLGSIFSLTKIKISRISGISSYINFSSPVDWEVCNLVDKLQIEKPIPLRVFAGNKSSHRSSFNEIKNLAEKINVLGKIFFSRGFILSIETHQGTVCDTDIATKDFFSLIDTRYVKLIIDIHNMTCNQPVNIEILKELIPHTVSIHVKNSSVPTNIRHEAPNNKRILFENSDLDQGIVNWKEYFLSLKTYGFTGILLLEIFSAYKLTKIKKEFSKMVALW